MYHTVIIIRNYSIIIVLKKLDNAISWTKEKQYRFSIKAAKNWLLDENH